MLLDLSCRARVVVYKYGELDKSVLRAGVNISGVCLYAAKASALGVHSGCYVLVEFLLVCKNCTECSDSRIRHSFYKLLEARLLCHCRIEIAEEVWREIVLAAKSAAVVLGISNCIHSK